MLYKTTSARNLRAVIKHVPLAGWLVLAALAVIAGVLTVTQGLSAVPAATTTVVILVLLFPWIAFGFREIRVRMPEPGRFAPTVALILLLPYLLYWLGTGGGSVRGIITLTVYLGVGALLVGAAGSKTSVWLFIAVVFLWLPFDLHWEAFAFLPWQIPWEGQGIMAGIWTWPDGSLGYPLSALLAVDAALLLLGWAQPLRLKFDWTLNKQRILLWLGGFVLLFAVILPLGLWTDFLALGPGEQLQKEPLTSVAHSMFTALAIFLFTGVPEELLFRGILQSWLENLREAEWWKWAALLLAAVIFGSAHLNNTVHAHTPPNLVYMGLATIAGVVYGYAWMKGGLVTAALLHTTVDWVWVLFFQGQPG